MIAMGQILRKVLDWFQIADLAAKLWRYFKAAWWCPMLTAITAFLYWIDWGLVCIGVLFLFGVIAGIFEWRYRLKMVREANDRVNEYKRDMDITWLQSRSFELDQDKRRKAVVRFMPPQVKPEAETVANVLESNGWNVAGPTPFYPENPELSLEHTVKLELPWGINYYSGNRYAATIARLTGHRVYVVDADPELEQGVSIRVTVYGPRIST